MKYARQCSVTGEGMNAGYCICDGEMYIKSEKHLSEHVTNDTEYASIEEAYEDDYYYYTEWETDTPKQTDMTQHERLELRQQNCGSFEYRLIEAWYIADYGNKARLEEAFKGTMFDLT